MKPKLKEEIKVALHEAIVGYGPITVVRLLSLTSVAEIITLKMDVRESFDIWVYLNELLDEGKILEIEYTSPDFTRGSGIFGQNYILMDGRNKVRTVRTQEHIVRVHTQLDTPVLPLSPEIPGE